MSALMGPVRPVIYVKVLDDDTPAFGVQDCTDFDLECSAPFSFKLLRQRNWSYGQLSHKWRFFFPDREHDITRDILAFQNAVLSQGPTRPILVFCNYDKDQDQDADNLATQQRAASPIPSIDQPATIPLINAITNTCTRTVSKINDQFCQHLAKKTFDVLLLPFDGTEHKYVTVTKGHDQGYMQLRKLVGHGCSTCSSLVSRVGTDDCSLEITILYSDGPLDLPRNPYCDALKGNIAVRAWFNQYDTSIPIDVQQLFPTIDKLLELIAMRNQVFRFKERENEICLAALPKDENGFTKTIITPQEAEVIKARCHNIIEMRRTLLKDIREKTDFTHLLV